MMRVGGGMSPPRIVTPIQLGAKVVAALASLLPFLATVETLKKDLDPRLRVLMTDPRLFLVTCFGIAYAATADLRATSIALTIAVVIFGVGMKEPLLYGDFRLGYGAVVGMDADAAVARVNLISPSLRTEKRESVDPNPSPGRLQIVHDRTNVVVAYKLG